MNSKLFWLSLVGIVIAFFGGFYLANSLNNNELTRLIAENEQLKKTGGGTTNPPADDTLSDEEIRKRIAEADASPDRIDFQRNLGLALLNYAISKQDAQLISESSRLLKRVFDKDPKDFDVVVALGTAFYDVGSLRNSGESWLQARDYYQKALELKPDHAAVRADYGSTFAFGEPPDFVKATAEIQKALDLEPKNPRVLLLMTQTLLKQNKPEAQEFYRRLKEVSPQVPPIETLRGDSEMSFQK